MLSQSRRTAIDFLNANLQPWTFEGEEPIVDALVTVLENGKGAGMSVGTYEAHDGRELAKRIANNGNGTAPTGELVRVALTPAWMVAPRTTAQLSSAERSKLTDDMVALCKAMATQIDALTRQLGHARADHQYLQIHLAKCGAMAYDIQTDTWPSPVFNEFRAFTARPFWQRLRWLVTGR